MIENKEYKALNKRCLTQESCEKWDYAGSVFNGKQCQVATYRDSYGKIVSQKVRFPGKDFMILGDTKAHASVLYGSHLWRDGGRMIVITEGEIDAISVSQLQGHKYPVVSIPNGAEGAHKAVAANIEWLEKFDKVIFMFDMDEPGRKAAQKCALLLKPGRAYIADLPLKDANECLKAERGSDVINAMWGAKPYRPDGVLNATDLWEKVSNPYVFHTITFPWKGTQEATRGFRETEILTICAGSGIGKSTLCRELVNFWLTTTDEKIGYIALEETPERTALGFMGMTIGDPHLHLGIAHVPKDELKKVFDTTFGHGRLYLYDGFGSSDPEVLMAKIRYLVVAAGCKTIVLDHLSILISGIGEGDERKLIDETMTKLKTLCMQLRCRLLLVSHLKRPEGKGHEDGAQTSLSQLRGSAAIGQLSDMVLAGERNQQGEAEDALVTLLRMLKNRPIGITGVIGHLKYEKETGRLREFEPQFAEEDKANTSEFKNESSEKPNEDFT